MNNSDRLAATRDKLAEAKYFLNMLDSQLSRHEAKYLLSALFSASRSITWVLQKELRSAGADTFDAWWESHRGDLSTELFPFRLLSQTRNTLVKEGNVDPLLDVTVELDDCTISSRWDQTKRAEGCQTMTFVFKTGQEPTFTSRMDSDEIAKCVEGKFHPPDIQAMLLEAITRHMTAMPVKLEEATSAGVVAELRYYFSADGSTHTMDEVRSLFDGYLNRVQVLVDDAAKQQWSAN